MQRKLSPNDRLIIVEGLKALITDYKHLADIHKKSGASQDSIAINEKRERAKELRDMLLTRGNRFVIDC